MNDPRETIIERLTRPREEPKSVSGSRGGWSAVVGGHVPARTDTIRFVRERFEDDRGLAAVEYDDEDDRSWLMVFGLTRTAGGWRVTGGGGGGRSGPESSTPWANLACWWGDHSACAGGRVHGADVRKVRVVAADGVAAEDDIGESGIALVFAGGPFTQPWTVELYDAADGLVRSHPFVGGRPG